MILTHSLSWSTKYINRRVHMIQFTSMSSLKYNHIHVERKWQEYWEQNKTFIAKRRQGYPKKYILDMFPYPSGAGLHVGHPEGYTATDILSRYYRMNGYDVLHPMGWDAFGLPAEQHAIQTNTHPAVTTGKNISEFKRQLKSLGFSYDWDREISTTDNNYVKWTQWIFLQLFKMGLAEQSELPVNWCPALGTVLANEEVIGGLSERGGHPVERIPVRQWVLKITDYADELEAGLDGLAWPEGTLAAQRSWIGRSEGATVSFKVDGVDGCHIDVFTTRPETLYGVTYLALAPEHSLIPRLTTKECDAAVRKYLAEIVPRRGHGGTGGVRLGGHVIHPLTGDKIPVMVADYVLGDYGTGAVMAVPAHDARDFVFANEHGLPIRRVIQAPNGEDTLPYTDAGTLCNCPAKLDGLRSSEDGRKAVVAELVKTGSGNSGISYRLHDWVFSRQRYWGEPIPIYFPVEIADGKDPRTDPAHVIRYDCPIPVPDDELPLTLPEVEDFTPGTDPQGCLARAKDWRYFQRDGQWFARETNTMPQWAGSCWYYMRFVDPTNDKELVNHKLADDWLPVDIYVGGQEHAVLHLLYARFWHKALYKIGVISHPEPFVKLVHQGLILGSDGEKMSKSKGNVVNPDAVVEEHGADALRMYEMFMGPLEATKPWQTGQVLGVVRFREKVYNLVTAFVGGMSRDCDETVAFKGDLECEMHRAIRKVTADIESLSFNTAISALMIYVNQLSTYKEKYPIPRAAIETLVLLLSPIAPHVAEECWQLLGHKESLAYYPWPKYDENLCIASSQTKATLAVQVNGKLRATIELDTDADKDSAVEVAMAHATVKKFVGDGALRKTIYVPGKILNFVVKKN